MPRMSEKVSEREFPEVVCKEQSEDDIEIDWVVASQKQETYSSRDENHDRNYEGFGARDQLQCDRRFSLSSCEPLIENRDGRYQLREDYWRPRIIYMTELDRGGDNMWKKSPARYYDEHLGSSEETGYKCQDCGSRRCSRGSEFCRLCLDVCRFNYSRLGDTHLNDFQSDIGRLESRRRLRSGELDRTWATDKGHKDYQQRSSNLNCSSDINITTPPRTIRTGICPKFLQGLCWRGESCWYVHDVAGRYHRGHSPYMLPEFNGGLLSTDNSPVKDGYLYSKDILNSHTRKTRYKRFLPSNADADCLFKKRRTESTWRHEDSDYSEEGGRRKRSPVARGGYLQSNNKEQSWEFRRRFETITEDSSIYKASVESLETAESNDVIGRRRSKIGRGESSYADDGGESSDSRSDSSDVNFDDCRSRDMSHHSDIPLSGKHSRNGKFHHRTHPRNRNSSSILKRYSLKRKADYYPDRKHMPCKDAGTLPCKYLMKGYCHRGNRCWFSHEIESSIAHVDLDEKKRSVTKHTSVATNEIPTSQHLNSTNYSKRSHQKKDQNSGGINKCRHVKSGAEHSDITTRHAKRFSGKKSMPETDKKDVRPDKGKKVGSGQDQEAVLYPDHKKCSDISVGKKIAAEHDMQKECKDSEEKTLGYQEGVDDRCANFLMGHANVKTLSVQKIVVGKILAGDPQLLNLKNTDSDAPSVNLDSCVEVDQTEETLKGHHGADKSNLPSAILKRHICTMSGIEATSGSCSAPNKPCPPCSPLEDVDNILHKNSINLNSQSHSSGSKVNAAQKATFSNGFEECSSIRRFMCDMSVEMSLGHQPEPQKSCTSVRERGKCVNHDQTISKNPSLCQKATCGVTSCSEKVAGEETFQEARVHDLYVGDDNVCVIQVQEGNNSQINNRSFASTGVNHSEATMASTDQVGQEMLVCETFPFTSNADSAASFQLPATEEASFDDIGLSMSLDHYIYKNLSLEHYISHMEDEKKETTRRYAYEGQSSFLADTSVTVTSENLIQHSNVYSQRPAYDGISETKPIHSSTFCTGLSPPMITSKEVEETTREPCFERHETLTPNEQEERPAVKLEPIDARNIFTEEICLHVNEEPSSSQKKRNGTLLTESSDKKFDSFSVAQTSERKPISSSFTSGRASDSKTNISEECGATILSSPHSKRYKSLASEQNKETLLLKLKKPGAVLEANEKCSSVVDSYEEAQNFSCNGSHELDSKCKGGNKDDDEKLLLRLAVLELAKEILGPLWKAGRIRDKNIYKNITRKVVDKVCASVQGVNMPMTKENVDRYLLHRKPKIAQLVLAYVSMYPVPMLL